MNVNVTYTREVAIGRIILKSAANGNAIGCAFAKELRIAVENCRADTDVRVVIIEAEGRNFCVGGDIGAFEKPPSDRKSDIDQITTDFHAALGLLLTCNCPVITAVQGAAAGAGMSLALAGDIVIAADDAAFVPAFTALGLSADGGTTWLLPRLLGPRRAFELLLTNRRLDAQQAQAWGLVSEICPKVSLARHAELLAQRLAAGPSAAFATIKRLLRQSAHTGFQEQVAAEAKAIVAHALGPDGEEGIAAFRAKRTPAFTERSNEWVF